MASVTITKHHAAWIDRTARRMSELTGRRVGKKEVLQALIETAMNDEAMYDPQTSEPLDPYRKRICQQEREARTASFDVEALMDSLRTIQCRS